MRRPKRTLHKPGGGPRCGPLGTHHSNKTPKPLARVKVLCCLTHPPPRPTALRGFSAFYITPYHFVLWPQNMLPIEIHYFTFSCCPPRKNRQKRLREHVSIDSNNVTITRTSMRPGCYIALNNGLSKQHTSFINCIFFY